MLKSTLAAGMVAGGLFALSPTAVAAVVSPSGLNVAADQPSNLIEVRRRGHRGFRGRHFGRHRFHGGRHFRHRGFGRRHFGHRHRHHRRWRGFYGIAPFIGYGYYRSGCGWLWRRYQYTGSYYWYRRWRACRYYYY